LQESKKILIYQNYVKQRTEYGYWGLELDLVSHTSIGPLRFKETIVNKTTKRPFNHGVLEIRRGLELGDADPHLPPQAKMPASPLNLLPFRDQACRHAAYGLLLGGRCGLDMKIYASGEVKTPLSRGFDYGLQNDFRVVPTPLLSRERSPSAV
jgi:hypothetical protein